MGLNCIFLVLYSIVFGSQAARVGLWRDYNEGEISYNGLYIDEYSYVGSMEFRSKERVRLTCHYYREAITNENAYKETSNKEKRKDKSHPNLWYTQALKNHHVHATIILETLADKS